MSEKKDPPPAYEASQKSTTVETTVTPTTTTTTTVSTLPSNSPRPLRAPLPLDLPALNMIRGRRVVLASASPRRKQLLAQIGLTQIDIVPSNFAEDLSKSVTPFEYALQTATEKALDVYRREVDNAQRGEPALIIAADTIVVGHWGEILEKPRSEKQHFEMLKMLRDHGRHQVVTAVACVAPMENPVEPGYKLHSALEETSVQFDGQVTDDLLLAYVRTREGVDKAGGYAIQGIGSILIERIEGSFDNVVGLPLRTSLQLIEKTMTPEADGLDESDGDDDLI